MESRHVDQVLRNVRIIDASGINFRLSAVADDVVVPHAGHLDWLMETVGDWQPDWLIFDPLVSFGVGESRVNDAEQGLVEAFRTLRNRLGCCIEGVHHSGKQNARDRALDQYSGRGGSALSDGCRMVAVMQPLNREEWLKAVGTPLEQGESGLVMALPKLSYCGPQEPIFIRRKGYAFAMATAISTEATAHAIEDQLFRFIASEFAESRRYSSQDLENSRERLGLTRQEVRTAITGLKVSGRVIYAEVRGKTGSHFQPVTVAETGGDAIQKTAEIEGGENEPSPC